MGLGSGVTSSRDAAFMALIPETFCCCIYTPLFGYTVWRLLLRKGRRVYIFCLVLLWTCIIFTFTLDWLRNLQLLGLEGESVDNYTDFQPLSWDTVNDVLSTLVIIIADGLLIYRCYTVCGERKWILMVLGAFLAADMVCGIIEFLPVGPLEYPRDIQLRMRPFDMHYFLLGLFLSSTIVTAVGTFLISHRILSTTRNNPSIASLTPYRKIQRIVIESGVIYSIGMLIAGVAIAVVTVLDRTKFFTSDDSFIETATALVQTYSQALLTPLAGISPTLIALRVARQSAQSEENETKPLSHLMFARSQPQRHTFSLGTLHSFIHFGSRSRGGNASTAQSRFTVAEEGEIAATLAHMEHHEDRSDRLGQRETV